ncbi:hypothetical protein JOD54_002054 [Actinokineospora baliensis]|uniref:hypothetical protein n=1 Tax=Actinokineospora baliensis TaxID=547056 RepID=UPI001956233D|nr:hypothetical protein [Actinokineospora baliensis]MBM7771850.1 hypothetical protein [Actinokineospora baliensis]
MTALVVLLVVCASWGFVFLLLRWLLAKPVREIRISVRALPLPALEVVVVSDGNSGKTGTAIRRR